MASLMETIHTKLTKGNPLTDLELDVGIEHFAKMGDMLLKSGPVFRLAAQEALRTADRLSSFKMERSRK